MNDYLAILLMLWLFDSIPTITGLAVKSVKAAIRAVEPATRSVPVYYDVALLPFLWRQMWAFKNWIAVAGILLVFSIQQQALQLQVTAEGWVWLVCFVPRCSFCK